MSEELKKLEELLANDREIIEENYKEIERLTKVEQEHQRINGELREENKRLNNIINEAIKRSDELANEIEDLEGSYSYMFIEIINILKGVNK